ncbi:DUF4279 domain-containing protein [Sphaerisporangium sp. B11E5]|uniref:DUF4279 domain-containing protein n=1 Tax=Sphaerisporangium sp. B11E5 TaxID=3153563 RepID=UPI00325F4477
MFRISLRLVSDDGDPAEVTAATGMAAGTATRAGEPSVRTGRPHKFSSWSVPLGPGPRVERPEEAFDALVSWGLPLARRFRDVCADKGWEASLVVVQEFRTPDEPLEKGISLSRELVEWLATAGAAVDVDQYIYY